MSRHSIKESSQLVVNGKKVDKLGTKVRLRDASISINALMRRVEAGEEASAVVGEAALKAAKKKADERRAAS